MMEASPTADNLCWMMWKMSAQEYRGVGTRDGGGGGGGGGGARGCTVI